MNLDEYIQALKKHDWYFEWSDDNRMYIRGRDQLKALREAQRHLDPMGTVWNANCPQDCRISPR